MPNKALRNTMRVWLQKQKKKEEAKAAAQATTPVAETTPAVADAPSEVDGADKPVDSVEEATVPGDTPAESATGTKEAVEGDPHAVLASAQPNEVGLRPSFFPEHTCARECYQSTGFGTGRIGWLKSMNTIDIARAGSCGMHISPRALADSRQDSAVPEGDDAERRGSLVSQTATQNIEPFATNAASEDPGTPNGSSNMMGNTPMMNGQVGFGFQGQGNFGGMGFSGMSNMMGNANWNNMNPLGMLHPHP